MRALRGLAPEGFVVADRRTALPVFYRTTPLAPLARAEGDPPGLPALAISSEYPVVRQGWMGERWTEILDHQPGAVVMDRAKNGLALLLDHSGREQVGRVRELGVGEDRVLRGRPVLSRSAKGQEVQQDVLDGIRSDVSVGYRIHEMVLERTSETEGDVYRVTKWEPLEVSLVAVPADPTVGAGRSVEPAEARQYPALIRGLAPEEPAMSDKPNPQPPAPVVSGGSDAARERELKEIAGLAALHGATDRLPQWIERGLSPQQVRDELLATRAAPVTPPAAGDPPKADPALKEYSITRAIMAMVHNRQAGRPMSGFEVEISQDREREKVINPDGSLAERGAPPHGGLWMPVSLPVFYERGAHEVATVSKGGELKFIEPGPFIELLRNRMLVRQLGARVLPGLRGDVSFPRQTGAMSTSWVGESPTADVSASNMTFDSLDLTPRIIQATTSYSRKLLVQGVASIDQLIAEDFAAIHALEVDRAAINGSGTLQPQGILGTSGIGDVALGTNGGVPTYDTFVNLETEVAIDNADIGTLAYLSTAQVRGRMKKSAAISASTGIPAWLNGEVNGYGAFASQQVPSNLTKGTSTTICHAIIFGNWAELIIGQWGDFEVVVDPYAQKKRGDIEVTTYQMVDVGVRHPVSFAAAKDALP